MPPDIGSHADDHLASGAYRRLVTWIREFEDHLDDDTEVGVRLVTFGRALSFHLCDLSYWNPHFIRFVGSDPSGNPVQLIQHINQVSVLLMKTPKQLDTPRRIGFDLAIPPLPGELPRERPAESPGPPV